MATKEESRFAMFSPEEAAMIAVGMVLMVAEAASGRLAGNPAPPELTEAMVDTALQIVKEIQDTYPDNVMLMKGVTPFVPDADGDGGAVMH